MPLLFSYGTLQQEAVQRSTFGRLLDGQPDELVGFEQSLLKIEDPAFVAASGKAHHAIVAFNGRSDSRVRGMVFELTDAELANADRYEPAGYTRVSTTLASGRQAWVYAEAPRAACADCGAPLPEGGSCHDYFGELLHLESQVPGGPGELPHFLAVGTYNLQHPSGFVPAALLGLQRTLADVLAGRATLDDARRRARHGARGAARVRRHADTVLSDDERAVLRAWPTAWAMTVLDVCRVRPEQYVERTHQWASSVSAALEGRER